MLQEEREYVKAPYPEHSGFCHIRAFDLNTERNTRTGEPPTLPADSFLVSYIHNGRHFHILLDAGKKGQGEHVIIPELIKRGIRRIDQLIISHMHRDHYGGAIDLLTDDRLEVGDIYYAPIPDEIILTRNKGAYPTWKELEYLLQAHVPNVHVIGIEHVGKRVSVDDELFWDILAVPNVHRTPPNGINDLNLVLKMHFRGFTALFPGDCGESQSEEVLSSELGEQVRDVFLLKAAHHGKGESLSKLFIRRCNAHVVLIPSNFHVVQEHREQLLEHQFEYSANGAKVYRLDIYEDVELFTDGHTVQCEARTGIYREKTIFELLGGGVR